VTNAECFGGSELEEIKFVSIYKFDGKSIIVKNIPVLKGKNSNEITGDTGQNDRNKIEF
jgi:hypothetical protein